MSDFGSAASQTANQLGRQSLDRNEAAFNNWSLKSIAYKNLNAAESSKRTGDDEKEATQDIAAAPHLIKTVGTFARAGKSAGTAVYHGATAGEAAGAFGKTLSRAGGAAKIGETSTTAAGEMGGLEGIIGGAIKSSFGKDLGETADLAAEGFAKTGAKVVGNVGAAIDTVGDIDNFVQTGNIFNSKNADGSIHKNTIGQDVGNIATITGGIFDVLAAFTGGALAPVAAAINIAAAAESTTADLDADSKDGKKDASNPPAPKPPPSQAPIAFAQLGMVANQSHNPLDHIN